MEYIHKQYLCITHDADNWRASVWPISVIVAHACMHVVQSDHLVGLKVTVAL